MEELKVLEEWGDQKREEEEDGRKEIIGRVEGLEVVAHLVIVVTTTFIEIAMTNIIAIDFMMIITGIIIEVRYRWLRRALSKWVDIKRW